ncbi:MAG: hypothetical protein JXA44_00270 [Methanospirillaceae archaeon]|nr:hypothetical protein [Methanospirillaceae archaeon]
MIRNPTPHGFSYSPVQEVSCHWRSSLHPCFLSVDTSPGTIRYAEPGQYTLSFTVPYPGWSVIAERLADALLCMVEAQGTVSLCRLVFCDLFGLSPRDDLTSLFSVSDFFPDITEADLWERPFVYTASSSVCGTMSEIIIRCNNHSGRKILLEFHLYSVCDRGLAVPDALSWFDAAHAEIHHLFDAIITETMRERLV